MTHLVDTWHTVEITLDKYLQRRKSLRALNIYNLRRNLICLFSVWLFTVLQEISKLQSLTVESTQSWLEFAVRLFPCAVLFSSLGSSILNFKIYIYVYIKKKNIRDRGSAGLYTVYILFLWSLNAKFQIPPLRRRVFALKMLDLWKCTNTRALMSVLMTLRPPCWPVLQSSVSADTTLTYSLQPYLIQLFHKTLENV